MQTRSIARYGWVRDLPNPHHQFLLPTPIDLPNSTDLRPLFPSPYDQGQIGSCTANAIAGVYEYNLIAKKKTAYVPSRLFIYYNERAIEGSTDSDSGAQLADGFFSLVKWGICAESTWTYAQPFTLKPNPAAYREAYKHRETKAQCLRISGTMQGIKTALAHGYAIAAGFPVYASFESEQVAADGKVPTPTQDDIDQGPIGGHAIVIVGYTADDKVICRNSWGSNWGQGGYFTVGWDYVLPYFSDFQTLISIS